MLITILTPCYNEVNNVEKLYLAIKNIFLTSYPDLKYNHLFIDNCSNDGTIEVLKSLAKNDHNVKLIINSRNFGHIRSPYYGLLEAQGDAVIIMSSDFQDPPEIINDLIKKWNEGYDSVLAIKSKSKENKILYKIRTLYYKILESLADIKIYKNFYGCGLYSRKVINELKKINDPYPFFRGLIAEVGYKIVTIEYTQNKRLNGYSKNKFYDLYDLGVLGIISNSKIPLRLAVFGGAISSLMSLFVGFGYFVAKLLYWDDIILGMTPIIILMSFMFSIMLFFIGIIGEYIGAIYTQCMNRPLVHEQERVNF